MYFVTFSACRHLIFMLKNSNEIMIETGRHILAIFNICIFCIGASGVTRLLEAPNQASVTL